MAGASLTFSNVHEDEAVVRLSKENVELIRRALTSYARTTESDMRSVSGLSATVPRLRAMSEDVDQARHLSYWLKSFTE